jgi:hypothetical protein
MSAQIIQFPNRGEQRIAAEADKLAECIEQMIGSGEDARARRLARLIAGLTVPAFPG